MCEDATSAHGRRSMMHIRIEQETQVNNGDPLYGLFALVVIVIVGVNRP
jgi:hypothetical protein